MILLKALSVLNKPATPDDNFDSTNQTSFKLGSLQVFNIGNSKPIPLMEYIKELENILEESEKIFLDMQQGDVKATSAETNSLKNWIGFTQNIY